MHENLFPFYLVLVPLLGIAAQWFAWRLQVPSILLLLLFGLGLGLWHSPDDILTELTGAESEVGPKLLFPIVSLSVAIILFEGGLTLRWNQLGTGANVVFRLIGVASLITWGLTVLISYYLLDFSWQLSWLLGAVLMVTGPTVVGPLLRQIRPNRRVSSVLQWEGILIDPVGAVAAVLVFEVITHTEDVSWFAIARIVVETLGIGVLLGCCGRAAGNLIQHWVPDFLHGVMFLVVALASFWLSNVWREESGLVTVTILGICLANQHYVSVDHVLEFKEHLRVFLISCLFIVLGSRLQLSALMDIGWAGIPFVLLLIFFVRPVSVFLGTIGTALTWKEKLFVGLVAPRGIVAASVASVFGLKLANGLRDASQFGDELEKANLLAPVTFLVILGTVTLCGLGAGPLARLLGLADANPHGVMFAGASRWVREVALALRKFDIRVLLIDTNYANVTAARMAGLDAKCGNVLSEHVQEEQDLAGIGNFLAVTPSDEVNTLATMEYMHVFSRASVYQLASRGKSHGRWQSIPQNRRGRQLFHAELNFSNLERMFEQGAVVKATQLTENFKIQQFRAKHGEQAVVLFAIDTDRRLRIRTDQGPFEPLAGDTVIAIVPNQTTPVPEKPVEKSATDLLADDEALDIS